MEKNFRALAIALLDDENGISHDAFNLLEDFAQDNNFKAQDIFDAVDAQDGRFFLPETHELKA